MRNNKIICVSLFIITLMMLVSSSYSMDITDITYNKDTSFIVYSNITKDCTTLNITTDFDNETYIPNAYVGVVVFNEKGQPIASQEGPYETIKRNNGYYDLNINGIKLVPTNNTGTPYSFFFYAYDPSDYTNNATFVHVLNETEIVE